MLKADTFATITTTNCESMLELVGLRGVSL